MGVIEVEFLEIRKINKMVEKALTDGTAIDKDLVSLLYKGYSESGKRVDQVIKLMAMALNTKGDKATKLIHSKNLLSEGAAIDMSATQQIEEKVKCSEMGGKLICRGDCLDYSGLEQHISACQKCEQFVVTRKQMTPIDL